MTLPSLPALPLLLLLAVLLVVSVTTGFVPSPRTRTPSVITMPMPTTSGSTDNNVCTAAAAGTNTATDNAAADAATLSSSGSGSSSSRIAPGVPISRIGYGTYRIGHNSDEQAESLRQALLQGINLIDTSANYGNGEAEEVIGQVLKGLMEEGAIKREDVMLVSKAGYIQGQNMERYQDGSVKTPDTVEVAPYLAHCIHPAFLQDQLDRSLARLDLPSLDVFLLHNPEYYLTHNVPTTHGEISDAALEEHRAEMDRRLFEAFKALESEIASGRGRIATYGISSNSFSLPPSHPHFLKFDHLVKMARRAAKAVASEAEGEGGREGKHHFSTIQMPGNLLEQEGLGHAVEWAAKEGLIVLINRPLNAFNDRMSLRLAEYQDARPAYEEARDVLLTYLDAAAEDKGDNFRVVFRPEIEEIDTYLHKQAGEGKSNVLGWENVSSRMIVPSLRRGLQATADAEGTFDPKAMKLGENYLVACEQFLSFYSGAHAREVVEGELGFGRLPEGKSLQEFALEWLLAKEGVTCVLLGCRNTRYVQDALKVNAMFPPVKSFVRA
jgi:aryl-alcohol dehydrogenase-like predicted oxidoreductase